MAYEMMKRRQEGMGVAPTIPQSSQTGSVEEDGVTVCLQGPLQSGLICHNNDGNSKQENDCITAYL